MKKLALIVLAAIMSCTMLFALAGCGKSDEVIIKEGLTTELDAFKDPSSDMWKDITASEGPSLEQVGLEMQAVIGAWTEGFSYEIGTITITGDSAVAEVRITCKQLMPVISATADALMSDEANVGLTEEELYAKYADAIMNNLKAADPQTTTVTIPCTKSGNNWTEATGAETQYANALMGQ